MERISRPESGGGLSMQNASGWELRLLRMGVNETTAGISAKSKVILSFFEIRLSLSTRCQVNLVWQQLGFTPVTGLSAQQLFTPKNEVLLNFEAEQVCLKIVMPTLEKKTPVTIKRRATR